MKKNINFLFYHAFTIKIHDLFKDALIQRLTEAGCLGVIEQNDSIIAYFPHTINKNTIAQHLSLLNELLNKSDEMYDLIYSYSLIPNQDWSESWKKEFRPIDVGEHFTILPPWEEKKKDRINLVIDPAMAFGTGHHGTTRSCLVLMERYAKKSDKKHFLDLGTGTGILAIAATYLGYEKVVAVDIDPLAVDASRKNAELNQTKSIEIRQGSISDLNETFNFIAANLISGALVQVAPALAAHLKPGGFAILSGILLGQEKEVVDAILQTGSHLLEQYYDDKWVTVVVGS